MIWPQLMTRIAAFAATVALLAWGISQARVGSAGLRSEAGQSEPAPPDVDAADELWANKDWEAAVNLYRQIVQEHPDSPEAARADRRIGLYEKFRWEFAPALDQLHTALAASAEDADAADAAGRN